MGKSKGASLEQAMPKPSKSEMDYQVEGDMSDMHRASAIAADPARLKKVHKLAGRKHKVLMGMVEPLLKGKKIKSIDDLKKARDNFGKDSDEDGDM